MFAGEMKLKTFLLVVACLGTLALGVGVAATAFFGARAINQVSASSASSASTGSTGSSAATGASSAPVDSSRPWDSFLVGKAGADLGGEKVKDATGGTSYKVNLYQDAGQASMNRAKVDLDRDEKWDEKWTFAPDGITRQVAPNDDEQYSQTFLWSGGSWVAQ